MTINRVVINRLEIIQPIRNFEGYYIDTIGNVYSKWINKGIHGLFIGDKLKKLTPKIGEHGHHYISLGRKHQKLIHRLVYETFKGPIPEGMLVRHLNDDPHDNSVNNLEIGTHKDNMRDCLRNGHHNPNRKIESREYKRIEYLKKELTWNEIAVIYGVNEKTVRNHIHKYQKTNRGIL